MYGEGWLCMPCWKRQGNGMCEDCYKETGNCGGQCWAEYFVEPTPEDYSNHQSVEDECCPPHDLVLCRGLKVNISTEEDVKEEIKILQEENESIVQQHNELVVEYNHLVIDYNELSEKYDTIVIENTELQKKLKQMENDKIVQRGRWNKHNSNSQ